MQLNDPSLFKTQCLINGEWTGTAETPIFNPATGEEIGKIPNMGAEETTQAIAHAEAAFKEWSGLLAEKRSRILYKWYELIMANAKDLAIILTVEQGKPFKESYGEILYAASFVQFYAEEAKRVYGETIPTHVKDARVVVIKQPVGVTAAITPWNFPSSMITRKVSPALAVGCTSVVKPAPDTPFSALALGELAIKAGIPAGVFQIVTGDAVQIGKAIMDSSVVKAVSFTGSTPVGKLLMGQASSTVKKVALELGGNAPFIIFDDADLMPAVMNTIGSKFRNTGQTCISANRIFVQSGIYDKFVEKFAEVAAGMKVGNGLEDGTDIGPVINEAAVKKSIEHINDAVASGAEVLVGGGMHDLGGNFVAPTVLKGVTRDMRVSREETFGPVAGIQKFDTEEEVIERANDTQYGLAGYFFSRDIGRVWRVAEALEYGMIGVNSALISTAGTPFGGMKESGLGREGSHYGIDEYVETKMILMGGV
ncbi:MAG: NAD-dependent succinate-semialdehyde dehydrogenase [Methyloligellaceae bacterium]